MIATLRRLRSLTPAQRLLIRSRRIEGDYTPAELITLLRPLAAFDHGNDRARGKSGCLIVLIVLALFGLLFLADAVATPVLLSIAGVLIVLGAVLVTIELRLRSLDISNNLRTVALPFLALLREDMARGSTVNVRIDLASPTDKAKRVRSLPPYKRGSYYKIIDTLYRDAWFSGHCRLADGSNLHWDVVDTLLESRRTKRNPRGKIKTKTKHRKNSRLGVSVALPLAQYRLADGPVGGEATRMTTRSDDRRVHVKLVRKVKSRSNDPLDVAALVDLVSTAYRRARPANEETRR